MIGRTDALAPASMVLRRAGRRRHCSAMSTTIALASAMHTPHTPATLCSVMPPHLGSARKLASSRGKTITFITKLPPITTSSGNAAVRMPGNSLLR